MDAPQTQRRRHFYPRSPCGERQGLLGVDSGQAIFLSTLSLRRATFPARSFHSPGPISIHALLAESDLANFNNGLIPVEFLSTLSLRRATDGPAKLPKQIEISIHALLAESDPPVRDIIQWEGIFLSTLSLRRATSRPRALKSRRCVFLSTLSLRRATRLWIMLYSCPGNFYPRSPCGERRSNPVCIVVAIIISIHALLAESDFKLSNIV